MYVPPHKTTLEEILSKENVNIKIGILQTEDFIKKITSKLPYSLNFDIIIVLLYSCS